MNSSLDFAHLMSWEDMSQALRKIQRWFEDMPEDVILWEVVKDLRVTQRLDCQAVYQLKSRVTSLEGATVNLPTHVATLQSIVSDLQQQIADLQLKVELQEQFVGVGYEKDLFLKAREKYVNRLMQEAMEDPNG